MVVPPAVQLAVIVIAVDRHLTGDIDAAPHRLGCEVAVDHSLEEYLQNNLKTMGCWKNMFAVLSLMVLGSSLVCGVEVLRGEARRVDRT